MKETTDNYNNIITQNLSINTEQLTRELTRCISHPHADVIARSIVGNLANTEVGISQLLMSFLGISPNCAYMIGDKILVLKDALPTWRFDDTLMQEHNMYFQGKMEAEIIDINMYRRECLQIEFEYYDKSGEHKKDRYTVNLSVVQPYDKDEIEL